MLAAEERAKLVTFLKQSPLGTPYRRRCLILLLTDNGATQEEIAANVQVPITRVRQLQRAYKREGLALFPESIWPASHYTADMPIPDFARQIISDLTSELEQYEPELGRETTVTAVHESRKATRKMRTALQLFAPYFKGRLLLTYRKRARRFMRRLGRSRDTAVLSLKLELFIAESLAAGRLSDEERLALEGLALYWQGQQEIADAKVKRDLAKGKHQRLLTDLAAFGRGEVGKPSPVGIGASLKTGYIAPIMIYDKLCSVRIMADNVGERQPERLHALRIANKELRYTLEFFEPLLGPAAYDCIVAIKQVLTHLGDVNDARIHLRMLNQVQDPALVAAVALYRGVVEQQLEGLRESFPMVWAEVDRQAWRGQLASAVAVL